MKRFASVLNRLNSRIDLPQPAKSRIMVELAADMNDCFDFYLDRGLSESEAEARVTEKFDLTDEALAELVNIHETPVRKWMDRISLQAQTRFERIVLALMLVAVGFIMVKTMGNSHFFHYASDFVMPMVGVALYATVKAFKKAFLLYIRQDHDIKRLRSGLAFPLVLSGVNLLIGFLGYFWELLKNGDSSSLLATGQIFLLAVREPSAPQNYYDLADWTLRSTATATVCLLSCLYMALIWYVFANQVAKIEKKEAEYLLYQ